MYYNSSFDGNKTQEGNHVSVFQPTMERFISIRNKLERMLTTSKAALPVCLPGMADHVQGAFSLYKLV